MLAADVGPRQQVCDRCPQQRHRRSGKRGGRGRIGIHDDALGIQGQHAVSDRMQSHVGFLALRLQGGCGAGQHVEGAPDFDRGVRIDHTGRIDTTVTNFCLECIDALEVAHPAKDWNTDHCQTEGQPSQAHQQRRAQEVPDFTRNPLGSEDQPEHAIVTPTGTDDGIDRLQAFRHAPHDPFRRLTIDGHFRGSHLDATPLHVDERRTVEGRARQGLAQGLFDRVVITDHGAVCDRLHHDLRQRGRGGLGVIDVT